jgi:hypothetical protein
MLDDESLRIENLSRMKFSFPSNEVGMKLKEERNTADGDTRNNTPESSNAEKIIHSSDFF